MADMNSVTAICKDREIGTSERAGIHNDPVRAARPTRAEDCHVLACSGQRVRRSVSLRPGAVALTLVFTCTQTRSARVGASPHPNGHPQLTITCS